MLKKIVLENFMAHELTEIELGPGVTALTGPNNTGKSAVVEALRCLATNPLPRNFIRHGAKEARVSVKLEDGTWVVWIRKKRSSGYEIWAPGAEEPEEYWKFGRKPPEDVLNALRLNMVPLDSDEEIDLHIGNQRAPVFLLDRPDSHAAAFFAASTESAHLLSMQGILKRRTADAKRRERELDARLAEVDADLDRLEPLPQLAVDLETARELETAANRLQSDIPNLERLTATMARLDAAQAQGAAIGVILAEVHDPPELAPVEHLAGVGRSMIGLSDQTRRAETAAAALTDLREPPALADAAGMQRVCEELRTVERRLRTAAAVQDAVAELAPVPETESVDQLSGMIDQMLVLRHRVRRLEGANDVLRTVAEPPAPVPDGRLQQLLEDMRAVMAAKDASREELERLESSLRSARNDIENRVGEVGCCPTCGAELDAEEFLRNGACHGA